MRRLSLLLLIPFLLFGTISAHSYGSEGCDSSTVLLSHYDGADAAVSTADEDCKGNGSKAYTFVANAQLDIAQSKFSPSSILFDGTGDFVTLPDSADWQLDGASDSNEWTIDFWTRLNVDAGGDMGFISQKQGTDDQWQLEHKGNTNTLDFLVRTGGSTTVFISKSWNPAVNIWYHVAVVKQGTAGYKMFINGDQIGVTETDTSTFPDYTGVLKIGSVTDTGGTEDSLNGWIDEMRITKGKARWKLAPFNSPSTPYCSGCEMKEVLL